MNNKNIKKLGKILEIILLAIIVVLLVGVGIYSYSKYIKKDKVANILGYTFMIVKSNSMNPTFKYGDKLIVKLGDSYVEGDIITYETDGIYITHRVVNIIGNKVITKGDNSNTQDEAINENQVLGVVIKIID